VNHTARVVRFLVRIAFGFYVWLALLTIVIPLCAALACTPGVERRRRAARGAARLFFFAIGSPVRLEGRPIPVHSRCVVVANHASYLDGLILTAALPPSFTYLIKREMASFPLAGFLLRRLGSAFVNRDDLLDRKRIARRLVELAVKGDALAFFPEGTFDEEPGLKPFQLGAFSAAARAKVPVVPLVIRGSRHKLPSGALFASPGGRLRVRFCDPVDPRQHGSARAVLQAARQAMLMHLDEPDLAPDRATYPHSSDRRRLPAAPM
jgi:1-acyl-sn-glycerol-3-phosphate acyltransferase